MQRYNRPWKCCLYPPADLPRGKTFFPSERRESNSFHYRNHATHRIRDWIHEMHFQLFWRRIHFNNLNIIQIPVCFAFSFHFLHLFFFAELTEFFLKTSLRTWHALRSIAHVGGNTSRRIGLSIAVSFWSHKKNDQKMVEERTCVNPLRPLLLRSFPPPPSLFCPLENSGLIVTF